MRPTRVPASTPTKPPMAMHVDAQDMSQNPASAGFDPTAYHTRATKLTLAGMTCTPAKGGQLSHRPDASTASVDYNGPTSHSSINGNKPIEPKSTETTACTKPISNAPSGYPRTIPDGKRITKRLYRRSHALTWQRAKRYKGKTTLISKYGSHLLYPGSSQPPHEIGELTSFTISSDPLPDMCDTAPITTLPAEEVPKVDDIRGSPSTIEGSGATQSPRDQGSPSLARSRWRKLAKILLFVMTLMTSVCSTTPCATEGPLGTITPTVSAHTAQAFSYLSVSNATAPPPIIDSGANFNMYPDSGSIRAIAHDIHKLDTKIPVYTAGINASPIFAEAMATFHIKWPRFPKAPPLIVRNALLVQGLSRPLISLSQLTAQGYAFHAEGSSAYLLKDDKVVVPCLLDVPQCRGLYGIPWKWHSKEAIAYSIITDYGSELLKFHNKIGHKSIKQTIRLYNLLHPKREPIPSNARFFCPHCAAAKISTKPFASTWRFTATEPGQVLSTDAYGPYRVATVFGDRFGLVTSDGNSGYLYHSMHSSKASFSGTLQFTVQHVQKVHKDCVVYHRSDNEFNTIELRAFFQKLGIKPMPTAPASSSSNGGAERAIRTIREGGRAMRHAANLPPSTQLLADNYFAYVHNHIPKATDSRLSTANRPKAPMEIMYDMDFGPLKNLLRHLVPFGAECWALKAPHTKSTEGIGKAAMPGERGVVLCRDKTEACWVVLSLDRKAIFRSRSILCNDTSFPFKQAMRLPNQLKFPEHINQPSLSDAQEATLR